MDAKRLLIKIISYKKNEANDGKLVEGLESYGIRENNLNY